MHTSVNKRYILCNRSIWYTVYEYPEYNHNNNFLDIDETRIQDEYLEEEQPYVRVP